MSVQALLVKPVDSIAGAERYVRLESGMRLTLGRSRSSDIVLGDVAISARHARLVLEDGRLRVEDLDSRNGTWIVSDAGEEERRIEAGEPVTLAEEEAVRVGSFHLIPCEMLAEDVALCSNSLLDISTQPEVTAPPGDASRDEAKQSALLMKALDTALSGAEPSNAWDSVLEGLVELTEAERAFLLSYQDERFLLRASRGAASLSQRFLETTLSRGGAWRVTPGAEPVAGLTSPSMRGFGPEITLTGVRLTSASGATVGVAYLEDTRGGGPAGLESIDRFVKLCGPVLELASTLDRATRRVEAVEGRLMRQRGTSQPQPADEPARKLLGGNRTFTKTVEAVRRAAPTLATILVRGPSGAGKEELACLAHECSQRRDQPLLAVNCAALPEQLIESELFGADKGAYTGAEQDRLGAFTRANGGTIFLDEIGDLPLAAQAKILRVIETGEVVRVGGSRHRVDVRVIAATHRDLKQMIAEGSFREDLYYRLRVVEVVLPSLAERAEDIPVLAEHFMKQFRRPDGSRVDGVSLRAARALSGYVWPGNVRELRNVMERAVVLDRDGVVDLDDLPPEVVAATGESSGAHATAELRAALDMAWPEAKNLFEAEYFRRALQANSGQVQKTAEATGVDRRTLSEKIRRHGLKEE